MSKAQLPKVLDVTSVYFDQTKTGDKQNDVLKFEVKTDQGDFIITDQNGDGEYDSVTHDRKYMDESYASHFQKEIPLTRLSAMIRSRVNLCENIAKRGRPYQLDMDSGIWQANRKFTLGDGQTLRVEATYDQANDRYELFCGERSTTTSTTMSLSFYCSEDSKVFDDYLAVILLNLGME